MCVGVGVDSIDTVQEKITLLVVCWGWKVTRLCVGSTQLVVRGRE